MLLCSVDVLAGADNRGNNSQERTILPQRVEMIEEKAVDFYSSIRSSTTSETFERSC